MTSVGDVTRFICLFHDETRGGAALSALEKLGIPQSDIDILGGSNGRGASREALEEAGVPEGDLRHLQDGLQKGGMVLSLTASEDRSKAIEAVFHKYNADKIDEAELQTQDAAMPLAAVAAPGNRTMEADRGETIIPIAQEELQVSKQTVQRGGVRVLRRTVEELVSQSVDLHGERVVLGYREVDRPATDADLTAGAQEFELIETAEVSVVQKVARVVEEVHVGKVASDHTEVIQDAVRHTEVEVEQVDNGQPHAAERREVDL